VKSAEGEVLIRTKEKRYRGTEYSDITVVENPDGTEVKLGEIASVKDTFRETDQSARFDGEPAAMVAVFRVGGQKPKEISGIVKEYVERKRPTLPESVRVATWNDMSELLESRMNLLLKNAFLGLILVFLILGLFLQIRLAMWVMLGIPISFLGALLMMPALDVSINMLSLFAFILALGIVVDDAIVVGENIFEHRTRRKSYLRAAVDGALEVAVPVIFSILTTVAAFLPLVFVSGTMGKFIRTIPFVVIPILAVSLIESLFVLPAHLGAGKPVKYTRGVAGLVERVRTGFGKRLEGFVAGPYRRFLGACLRNRYTTVAASVAVLFMAAGLVGGGVVKFRFMPEVEGDFILVNLEMPIGTPVEVTDRAQAGIVRRGQEVIEHYDEKLGEGGSILRHIFSVVGGTLPKGPGDIRGGEASSAHVSEVAMMLTPSEDRDVPVTEVARLWRRAVGEVPGADSITFESTLVHFGANIDIQLSHDDFGVLSEAAGKIKRSLADYPGIADISDNYSQGKRELKLRLKPEARTLGVTEEDLARQVRAAFYGAEALRIQRGRNEVKVMVRYPESDRRSLGDLESMRIRTPGGGEIPFSRASYVEEGRGYSQINRTNNKRVVNVTASVDAKVANAEEIIRDLTQTVLAGLSADYPGLVFDLEGEDKERRESMSSMATGFAMILFLMYALLAVPFKSYSQPLIVLSAIPFGVVGAILGHWIMGFDLSILSMFGIVALAGVVVNDSLLLIDYINRKRRGGLEPEQAVVEGGRRRFRPILLTSLTTFFGLMPMITETSVQAQFLIPMAISLAFGILFATGITLLLIPSLYLILEDFRRAFGLRQAPSERHALPD
jgi:multidrug efflux pump subunit AcrB